MLFEHFESYDVQATRRVSKAEGKAESFLIILDDLGEVSEKVRDRIFADQDLDLLTSLLRGAVKADSIHTFLSEYLPEL